MRQATPADIPELARIRATPEVLRWWRGGDDLAAAVAEDLAEEGTETFVIEHDGRVAGAIQWSAEDEPDYRHAGIDIYIDPALHGRGLGADAIRTLAGHLIDYVASTPEDLFRQMQGKSFKRFDGKSASLNLTGQPVIPFDMTLKEHILDGLMDPNIAFLLLAIGALAPSPADDA